MSAPTSLPPYMGFILENASNFNITKEQKKDLMAIKSVIKPKAHSLKDGIIEAETAMARYYQENKNREIIEELSLKASDFRFKFATIKTECRDQVLEVISKEQWIEITKSYATKRGYKIDHSLENVCAIPNQNGDTMALQTAITTFEKEIQEMSLNNIAIAEILYKVKEMEEKRQELVVIKLKA